MSTAKETKKAIRKEILAKRDELSKEYYLEANQIITENVLELDVFKNAETVFIFKTMGKEFDTESLIQNALENGKRVGFPRVISIDEGMMVHEYKEGDQLVESYYGAMEPSASADEIKVEELDLVIMPCVTSNNKGERIGYGGGFYDRFLSNYDGITVLPIFNELQTADIPVEDHDQKVDYVVTESSVVHVLE